MLVRLLKQIDRKKLLILEAGINFANSLMHYLYNTKSEVCLEYDRAFLSLMDYLEGVSS